VSIGLERRGGSGLSALPGCPFGAAPFALGAVALAFLLGAFRRRL
jgi:hypothetical protein